MFEMPQRYKKTGIRNQWTADQLDKAKEAVKSGGLNINGTAKMYGIPYSTLRDNLKGNSKKWYGGCPTVLHFDEEKEIYLSCQVLQQFGFHLNIDTAGIIVRAWLPTRL